MKNLNIPSNQIEQLKQLARKLKRSQQLTHTQALDEVAKQYGFYHWHHATQCNKGFRQAEDACRNGYVFAYDVKDALDIEHDDVVIRDDLIQTVLLKPMFDSFINGIDDESGSNLPRKELFSENQLVQYFVDFIQNYTFFRLSNSIANDSIDEVIKLLRTYSFWMPEIMCVKGKFVNTYDLPSLDEEGSIVGVRF